jgi:hypothetical protein
MSRITVSNLLRLALRIDAIATAASGVLLAAAAGPLAEKLGLPQPLLLGAGLFCLGYAGLVGWMSAHVRLPAAGVWAIVLGNVGWAIGCLELAFTDVLARSSLGVEFLVVQAVAVLVFADLQWFGLRRSYAPVAAAA